MTEIRIIDPVGRVGFILSLVMLGFFGGYWLNLAMAQNGSGIDDGGSTGDIFKDLQNTVIAIGTLVAIAGTVLGMINNARAQKMGKYMQTYGNKSVELSSAVYRLAKAGDAATQGELGKQLERVKIPMNQLRESADKAKEQLEYLAPKENLPNDPDKDPAMPRESFKAKRGTDDIDPMI